MCLTVDVPSSATLNFGNGVFQISVLGARSYSSKKKKCSRSRRIGPPTEPASCWFLIGTTRASTGFSALKRSSRKLPRNEPANRFVPDLVIMFTCTPDERPCVASNRFEMYWNSAIISWLNAG